MFGRGMNKKGQEGLTLTTLLLIVLGIVVVVVIVLGVTGAFDFIFGKVEQVPGQSLETALQACGVAAQNNLRADYCSHFREVVINGQEQFVTCTYLAAADYLSGDNVLEGECGALEGDSLQYCQNEDLGNDEVVNGRTCEEIKTPSTP